MEYFFRNKNLVEKNIFVNIFVWKIYFSREYIFEGKYILGGNKLWMEVRFGKKGKKEDLEERLETNLGDFLSLFGFDS